MGGQNRNVIWLLIVVAVAGGLYFFHSSKDDLSANANTNTSESSATDSSAKVSQPASTSNATSTSLAPSSSGGGFVAPDDNEIQTKFAAAMKQMDSCLQTTAGGSEKAEASYDNLVGMLRGTVGEVVASNDDSVKTEIVTSSGAHRLVHVLMDYASKDGVYKKVKYYEKDALGNQIEIPLDKDLASNPSDTFVASLEGDGQVTNREKKSRSFFSNGEELMYVEMNGKMTDFELTRASGHKFKCANIYNPPPQCDCR